MKGRAGVRRPPEGALVFLRGRDADDRLKELMARRAGVRPLLGALANVFLHCRGFERLGFRCLGDWTRERIGVGAGAVREWARVWRVLEKATLFRRAVLAGEVSWTVARKIASRVTPENEIACIETVRGRTVRAVEVFLKVAGARAGHGEDGADPVPVRVPCSGGVATRWAAALELARRMAGEPLPTWECAEAITAEWFSAFAAEIPHAAIPAASNCKTPRVDPRSTERSPPAEDGRRARVWPQLDWRPAGRGKRGALERLGRGLGDHSPRQLDRRFRMAIAFLQGVDFEIGRVLRQLVDRRLYRELGFESFEQYVTERLDLSPRTARRLVRLARAQHTAPEVASAFRAGRITLLQAEVLLRGGNLETALRVTLRALENRVPEREVRFSAPRDLAALFRALVSSVGLERVLDHAIATWLEAGSAFRDYADFERDGWRCTVPACTARRNLQSHHIRFRSAGGPDLAWNRTTLCAFHHHRGVHAGRVSIHGRAPERLTYALGIGRFRSGDVRISG